MDAISFLDLKGATKQRSSNDADKLSPKILYRLLELEFEK